MKDFDLEQARGGAPVCTAAGQRARVVCWDMKDAEFVLLALVDNGLYEEPRRYRSDGSCGMSGCESPDDLRMRTERHEGWVNIYRRLDFSGNEYFETAGKIHSTKEEAASAFPSSLSRQTTLADTVKIEWED